MQNKLIAVKDYDNIEIDRDVTKLLIEIRGVSHQMESSSSIYDTIDEAKVIH